MEANVKNKQIQAAFSVYSLSAIALFFVFGIVRDGIGAGFQGFLAVQQMPAQMTLDYFKAATVSGAFLNVGLVGLSLQLVWKLTGAKLNGGSFIGFFLSMGFAFFGMNVVNIWPCILGTFLYALVVKESFAVHANMAVFSTACAPFVSEMYFRYAPIQGNLALRVLCGLAVGLFAGFMMPIVCKKGPDMHKGLTILNAATGAGFIAIFLYSLCFKAVGVEGPTNTDLGDSIPIAVNSYVALTCVLDLALAYIFNGKSFKNVLDIYKKSGLGVDLTADRPALAVFNVAVYSAFMTIFYNAIGCSMNGPTLAAVICTTCVAASGGHVLNMIPIIIGYAIASSFCTFTMTTQAIVLGLCYAAGLCPLAGCYGPLMGIVAGMVHAILVTQVVTFHNAFCFYNGGFTTVITAIIFGAFVDAFFERDTKFRFNPLPMLKKK